MNWIKCRIARKISMQLLASHLRNAFFLKPKVKANGQDPRNEISQMILWLEVFYLETNSILLVNNDMQHPGYQEVSYSIYFLLGCSIFAGFLQMRILSENGSGQDQLLNNY